MDARDRAIADLRDLLRDIAATVQFGTLVSPDYVRGYVTGRGDLVATVDATVSGIIADLTNGSAPASPAASKPGRPRPT